MKRFYTCIALLVLTCLWLSVSGQWKKYIIDDEDIKTAVSIDTTDLNGDTLMDLVVVSFGNSKLFWYENDFPNWIKHTIDSVATGVTFAYCGDVDGDDTMDIVANLHLADKMVWYENNYPHWTRHVIDPSAKGADYMEVADLNLDGAPDVVSATNVLTGGDLVWYENSYPDWNKHVLESGSLKYAIAKVTDLNQNGLPEITVTDVERDLILWFTNEVGDNTWTKDTIAENLTNAWALDDGDINGDGWVDLVATGGGPYYEGGNEVVWYEQENLEWTMHIIDSDLQGANIPSIWDVDGDDTLDVVAGGYKADDLVWYENNHPTWIKHVIDGNIDGPRFYYHMDVDGDRYDDIILCAKNSLVWYKHPGNTAYATSFEVSPYSIQASDDTLTIQAGLQNPDNHPMCVFAVIRGEQSQLVDTLYLSDDGLHGDGNPADHNWAFKEVFSGYPEDVYEVNLVAYDSIAGNSYDYVSPARFISIGPIGFDSFSITSSHQVFTPGELIDFTLTLKNHSTTALATNIRARLTSLDPYLAVSGSILSFGDIPAGQGSESEGSYQSRIMDKRRVNMHFPVAVDIYHELQPCWKDTFFIFVYEKQPVNIPDTAFLYALIDEGVDANKDSLISYAEAEVVKTLWITERGISELKGIEAFVNLDTLRCEDNELTNLDLSYNTTLMVLGCTRNQLVGLDISENTNLRTLDCSDNPLMNIDVSNNKLIWYLNCHGNQLSNLDISLNTALTWLSCENNNLDNLVVSNHTNLKYLDCSFNNLSGIDVSNNLRLIDLACGGNQMTKLDISRNDSIGAIDIRFASPQSGLRINHMPSLGVVCVWENFRSVFDEGTVYSTGLDSVYVDTTGSPNVSFLTDCYTGIEESSQSVLAIYPNPTNSRLTIETGYPDHYSINISSLNGLQLLFKEMEGPSHQIDLSSFESGVYFITIRSKDFVTTRKIVKL